MGLVRVDARRTARAPINLEHTPLRATGVGVSRSVVGTSCSPMLWWLPPDVGHHQQVTMTVTVAGNSGIRASIAKVVRQIERSAVEAKSPVLGFGDQVHYRIQRACTMLGNHGGEDMSLWEALLIVTVVEVQEQSSCATTDDDEIIVAMPELFNCPVCSHHLSAPIFQCSNCNSSFSNGYGSPYNENLNNTSRIDYLTGYIGSTLNSISISAYNYSDPYKRVELDGLQVSPMSSNRKKSAKVIEKHVAQLCVLVEDCDQADYAKLVKALCADNNVNLKTVPSAKTLGEWAGISVTIILLFLSLLKISNAVVLLLNLSKIDSEGKTRKVVGCSCIVVKDYGEESEGLHIVQEYGTLMSGACCLWKTRMGTQIWWWLVATLTMEEHRRSSSRRGGVGTGLTCRER
ncbi:hypothetical protein Sjap_018059 [Stephania japonica]|uniref:Ribosomal protein eL8/eL30/eS12/Gadd45 domain-containing protein n=1 Tax=Stephania japonica TaxID=461633 RepID=A0AAP0I7C4_9MAGN